MGMKSLSISLPQDLKDYLDKRVEEGGYGTPSEFIRELLQVDQMRRAEARLDQLLLEGLRSGEPVEVTPELWVKKRLALVERHQKKSRP